ncbi:MAG: MFS transporter [Anaerolineae bacterium]|nr:MFS transporter [Anaerolineae bacterium]
MPDSTHSPRQTSAWLVLAIVSLPVFIGALDLTIISAVLPEVIVSLELPVKEYLDQASWAVSGYLLAYAISMTFTGRLSDLVGRRYVYIACLLIFMIGSYLVTAYDNTTLNSWISRFYNQVLDQHPPRLEERHLYLVIAGRVIQAFGAGAMVPVTIALAGDLFPADHRAKPVGVIGAVDTLGWVLGHLYGGVMVRFFGEYGTSIKDAFDGIGLTIATPSWETLFILNIPISLLALIGAWWVLRNVPQPRHTGRFDILGTLFITLALIGLNLGLGTGGAESAATASSFEELGHAATDYGPYFLIGAAILFMMFLVIEARVTYPLVRLGMFRNINFSAASVTNGLVGFCLAIGLVSAPLLVNFRMEETTGEEVQNAAYIAGLLLSGLTVPMAIAAIPGGWLSERYGYRVPTVGGLILACAGFTLTGFTWASDTSYWLMGAEMAIIGVGLGLTISPIGTAALNTVGEDERGVASALILILRLIGMTVAISWLTMYSLDRFDVLKENYLAPEGASLEEALAAATTANLEAAVDVIKELQYIGAVVSGAALIIAFFLRGGRRDELVQTGDVVASPNPPYN